MTAVESFLAVSQQRLLQHCRDLLAVEHLGSGERRRLERLVQESQAVLAELADRHQADVRAR